MRRRRRLVQQRRSFFIAGEGQSERAFVRFLQRLCDEAGLPVYLDVKPQDGGGAVNVIKQAGRWLEKNPPKREYKVRLVLLDRDRIEAEPARRQTRLRSCLEASIQALRLFFKTRIWKGSYSGCIKGRNNVGLRQTNRKEYCSRSGPSIKNRQRPSSCANASRWTMFGGRPQYDQQLRRLLEVIGL